MQRTHINKPFTLVELMVVIAIIAIIMGLSVPAFRKITVGSGVDAASRMLSSQLMLARAEAIARRKYVAVIIPGQYFTKSSDDRSNYHFTSFRSAFVTKDNDLDYTFDEWIPGTQWTFLPTGAVIQMLEKSGADKPVAIKLIHDDEDGKDKYLPNSSYNSQDDTPNDTSSEHKRGFGCDSECTAVNIDTNYVRAIIFKPNGRCAQKNYLTVMEGVVEVDSAQTTRLNSSNIRVMEVDQYSGQVRYLF